MADLETIRAGRPDHGSSDRGRASGREDSIYDDLRGSVISYPDGGTEDDGYARVARRNEAGDPTAARGDSPAV